MASKAVGKCLILHWKYPATPTILQPYSIYTPTILQLKAYPKAVQRIVSCFSDTYEVLSGTKGYGEVWRTSGLPT